MQNGTTVNNTSLAYKQYNHFVNVRLNLIAITFLANFLKNTFFLKGLGTEIVLLLKTSLTILRAKIYREFDKKTQFSNCFFKNSKEENCLTRTHLKNGILRFHFIFANVQK